MRRVGFILCLVISWISSGNSIAAAPDGHLAVKQIRIIANSARMMSHKNLKWTQVSGPVGTVEGISVITQGDIIKVKDRSLTASLIYAITAKKDYRYGGKLLTKKGQTSCIIVESDDNLPYSDRWANRLWINVNECEVLKGATDDLGADQSKKNKKGKEFSNATKRDPILDKQSAEKCFHSPFRNGGRMLPALKRLVQAD